MLKKYNSMSVQVKSALWFTVCSLLQKGISFITVPIFTRLLTTEEYGIYSLYLSWYQILTVFTSLYLYNGVLNNAMAKFEMDRDRYISSMQGLTFTVTAIWLILFLILRSVWEKVLGLSTPYIILMFIEMFCAPALLFWSGRQRFEYQYKRLVIVTIGSSIANPLLGLLMVYTMSDGALARVESVVIVEAIICVVLMIYQFCKGKCFFDKKYWAWSLKLAIPLLPHYLAGIVLNQGDRIMIDKMVGTSAVAIYSVAYSIGMLVQLVTNAISNSLSPWFYDRIKQNDFNSIKRIVNGILLLIVGVVICLMLVSPEVVYIFGDSEYAEAVYVILPVAASTFFIFIYSIVSFPQFYFEKTRFLAISSISVAILNIILNYIFISLLGYIAAGYTTLACYALYALGHYLVSKRVCRKNIEGDDFYDGKVILLEAIVVIVACVVINFILPYIIIRYVVLFIILVVVFIKRKAIWQMLTRKDYKIEPSDDEG